MPVPTTKAPKTHGKMRTRKAISFISSFITSIFYLHSVLLHAPILNILLLFSLHYAISAIYVCYFIKLSYKKCCSVSVLLLTLFFIFLFSLYLFLFVYPIFPFIKLQLRIESPFQSLSTMFINFNSGDIISPQIDFHFYSVINHCMLEICVNGY